MDVEANAISNVTTDNGGTLEAPYTITGPEAPAPETPKEEGGGSKSPTESELSPKGDEAENAPKEQEKEERTGRHQESR